MKKTSFVLLVVIALVSGACSESPESAAQKVCDCADKALKADADKMIDEMKTCKDLYQKHAEKFEGEQLRAYRKKAGTCIAGNVWNDIKNAF